MYELNYRNNKLLVINRKNDILNNKKANDQGKRICKTYMFISGYINLFFCPDIYKISKKIHSDKLRLYLFW